MTDTDQRLEAVAKAHREAELSETLSWDQREAQRFIAMRDALREFDQAQSVKVPAECDRNCDDPSCPYIHTESEVMPHKPDGQSAVPGDNATAPVMGADPPWLVQCMDIAFAGMTGLIEAERLEVLRCAIAFAAAQPPAAAEIEEATREYYDAMNGFVGYHQLTEPAKLFWREKAKRILIAGAKARSGA